MSTGSNIKKFRELQNLNVPQLAEKIGANKQSVYDWENDKYAPSKEYMDSLAKTLGVDVRDFYGDGNVQPKQSAEQSKSDVPESVYKDLVEANSDYTLVPKTILREEYRIMLKSELDDRAKLLKEVIESKNNLIEQLKSEIRQLQESVARAVQPK